MKPAGPIEMRGLETTPKALVLSEAARVTSPVAASSSGRSWPPTPTCESRGSTVTREPAVSVVGRGSYAHMRRVTRVQGHVASFLDGEVARGSALASPAARSRGRSQRREAAASQGAASRRKYNAREVWEGGWSPGGICVPRAFGPSGAPRAFWLGGGCEGGRLSEGRRA